jgi:hypothetical protein
MAHLLAEAKGKLQINHYYGVPVSDADIASGIPESVSHCAFGNGLRSADCGDPIVKTPYVSFNRGPWRYRAVLDSVAIRRDWAFDDASVQLVLGPLQPMMVVIEVIEARLRTKLGTRASRGLPPKGPHRPARTPPVCRPVKRRYHELKKFMTEV